MRIWNVSLSTELEKDPFRGGEFIGLNDTKNFTQQVFCSEYAIVVLDAP